MTPKYHQATITIQAPPVHVWALLTDVTRMGEWSPECRSCDWLDGADRPAVGARFKGHNVAGPIRWTTTCRVDRAEEPEHFGFEVLDHDRTSSRWTYQLKALDDTTTELTETFRFVWCPWYSRAVELLLPRARHLYAGIDKTLVQLKAAAEKTAA